MKVNDFQVQWSFNLREETFVEDVFTRRIFRNFPPLYEIKSCEIKKYLLSNKTYNF